MRLDLADFASCGTALPMRKEARASRCAEAATFTPMKTNVSEADFSREAEKALDAFLALADGDREKQPTIAGVSLFEPNTAPLVMYYFRKGLKARALGQPLCKEARPFARLQKTAWSALWFLRELMLSTASPFHRESPSPADVLFVCNVVRQHDSIGPVMARLAQDGLSSAVVSKTHIPERTRVQISGIRYYDWSSLRCFPYWAELVKKTVAWRRYWNRSLRPRLSGIEAALVHLWFENKALASVRALLLAETVIQELRPSVIVVTDPADAEAKVFTSIGKKKGTPSFCIQYGMAGPGDSEWRYFSQDYVGAFDAVSAEGIHGHGIPKERILPTGNPRFDSYRPSARRRERVRRDLQIPDGAPMVAFMSIPPAPETVGAMESYITLEEHGRLLKAVYDLAKELPEAFLVVKPHPEEAVERHAEQVVRLDKAAQQVRLVRDQSSYEIINAADLVVTTHSTTGLEAIYLDRPLVTLNLTGRPDYDDYAASGAALAVRRPEGFAATIRDLLSQSEATGHLKKGRERYRFRNPCFARGFPSADRCAAVIRALKSGEPPPRS